MNSLLLRSIQLEFETSTLTIQEICEKHKVSTTDLKGHTTWKKLIKPQSEATKASEHKLVTPKPAKETEVTEKAIEVKDQPEDIILVDLGTSTKDNFRHADTTPNLPIDTEVVDEEPEDKKQKEVDFVESEIITTAKLILTSAQSMIASPMMDLTPRDLKDLAATLSSLKESIVGKQGPVVNINNFNNQVASYAKEQLSLSQRDC